MATTRQRQSSSRAAATKKAAAREAAPAAVTEEKSKGEATTAEAPETAPQAAGQAADVSPSVTVQTQEPEAAQNRAAQLAFFTNTAPEPAAVAPEEPVERLVTGKTDDWTDGSEGVQALVIVDLFKATLNGSTHFGYKGTVITAPEAVVERGIRFGALSKEF